MRLVGRWRLRLILLGAAAILVLPTLLFYYDYARFAEERRTTTWRKETDRTLFAARLRVDTLNAITNVRDRRPFDLLGRIFTPQECAEITTITIHTRELNTCHLSNDGTILHIGNELEHIEAVAEVVDACKRLSARPAAEFPRAMCGHVPGTAGQMAMCTYLPTILSA